MGINVLNKTTSTAQMVRDILSRRPFLVNALGQGIVNHSALARLIQKEIGGEKNLEAIKAAIMREKNRLIEGEDLRTEKVLQLLKRTKTTLRDKIAIVISRLKLDIPYIVRASLSDSLVYMVDETKLRLEEARGIYIHRNLVALMLTSPKDVEDTPGFVAFIAQLLASRAINVKEFISCHTDTIIVLEPEDATQVLSILQQYA
jgi:hypothetical protein